MKHQQNLITLFLLFISKKNIQKLPLLKNTTTTFMTLHLPR